MVVLLVWLQMAEPSSNHKIYWLGLHFATTSIKQILFSSVFFVNESWRSLSATEPRTSVGLELSARPGLSPGASGGAVLPPRDSWELWKSFLPVEMLWRISVGSWLFARCRSPGREAGFEDVFFGMAFVLLLNYQSLCQPEILHSCLVTAPSPQAPGAHSSPGCTLTSFTYQSIFHVYLWKFFSRKKTQKTEEDLQLPPWQED